MFTFAGLIAIIRQYRCLAYRCRARNARVRGTTTPSLSWSKGMPPQIVSLDASSPRNGRRADAGIVDDLVRTAGDRAGVIRSVAERTIHVKAGPHDHVRRSSKDRSLLSRAGLAGRPDRHRQGPRGNQPSAQDIDDVSRTIHADRGELAPQFRPRQNAWRRRIVAVGGHAAPAAGLVRNVSTMRHNRFGRLETSTSLARSSRSNSAGENGMSGSGVAENPRGAFADRSSS